MITQYLILIVGLLILVKGADIMISSASRIAKIINVPSFIIGMFIVAIGTSAPEAAIGIFSGLKGTNLLTLGDVVGSNIINTTVIIGLTSLIFSIKVDSQVQGKLILSILIQIAFVIMIFTSNTLSRIESVILLVGVFIFLGYLTLKTIQASKQLTPEIIFEGSEEQKVLEDVSKENKGQAVKDSLKSMPKQTALFFIGLAGLVIGANFVVNSSVEIAHSLGWSEEFIGLTVLAFGTSLPELVACVIAAIKKEEDIALGNIIGSNIFNILFVLGISGLLNPIVIEASNIFFDLLSMIGASILLMVLIYFYRKLSKKAGFLLISYYIIYLSIKLSGLL